MSILKNRPDKTTQNNSDANNFDNCMKEEESSTDFELIELPNGDSSPRSIVHNSSIQTLPVYKNSAHLCEKEISDDNKEYYCNDNIKESPERNCRESKSITTVDTSSFSNTNTNSANKKQKLIMSSVRSDNFDSADSETRLNTPQSQSIDFDLDEKIDDEDDLFIINVLQEVEAMKKGKDINGKSIKGSDLIHKDVSQITNGKNTKITDRLIKEGYKKFSKIVKGKDINAGNVMVMVTYAIKISDSLVDTSKTYKFELVMFILRKYIDNNIDGELKKEIAHMLIENAVPVLMEGLFQVPTLFKRACRKAKSIFKPYCAGCCGNKTNK